VIRALAYGTREALASLRRNSLMSLASVTTVAVCLTVLASTLLVAGNLDHLAAAVEAQVQIRVFIAEDATPETREALAKAVAGLEGVASVEVVTREEALERLREQFGSRRELLDAVEEMNPLRDSLEVAVARPEQVVPTAEVISRLQGVAEVNYGQVFVDKLFSVTRFVRWIGLGLVALLTVATVLIISNTVRLTVFARREEIGIMKLVGATDWFIRWPFLLEGLFLGMLGAGLTAGLTWQGYPWLVEQAERVVPFLPLLAGEAAREFVRRTNLVLVVLGAFLGAVGSTVSLRRFLRV